MPVSDCRNGLCFDMGSAFHFLGQQHEKKSVIVCASSKRKNNKSKNICPSGRLLLLFLFCSEGGTRTLDLSIMSAAL